MAKFCEKCGNELQDAAVFCPACGANANETNPAGQGQPTGSVYNGAQYYPTTQNSLKEYNLMSILGLMLSAMSFFLNAGGIPAMASILLSFTGLYQTMASKEKGKVFAIAGLAVGGVSFLYQTIAIFSLL